MLNRSQWHCAVIECCASNIPRGLTHREPAVLPKNPAAPQPLRGPPMKLKVRVAVVKSKQPTVMSGRYAVSPPVLSMSGTGIRIIGSTRMYQIVPVPLRRFINRSATTFCQLALTLLWLVLDIWRCHGKEVAAHGSETIPDLKKRL